MIMIVYNYCTIVVVVSSSSSTNVLICVHISPLMVAHFREWPDNTLKYTVKFDKFKYTIFSDQIL